MTKSSQFNKGNVILTNPEEGYYGIAVVLSEKKNTHEFYPWCHIAITPLIFERKVQLQELDINQLKPLVFKRSYNLKGKEKFFKEEISIGIYTRSNKHGFEILGSIDPKKVYDGPLPFMPLTGLDITFPMYDEVNNYLGREAFIQWASEHIVEIDCKHGKGISSIVCSHLLSKNKALGFIENASDPHDLQGWCYDCENLFLKEGEMSDKFLKFSSANVVCTTCYDELKTFHQID
ncbi:hypothetical protein [uncultured Psychroserpens sp.]|uniref:hypothetical protein n=1 Tax=uncultured Psychroserpens sp. TaxID=255436 RepID=UPI00261727A0|nr:hypothetical protein [uncultured Psychroserpens sp.]